MSVDPVPVWPGPCKIVKVEDAPARLAQLGLTVDALHRSIAAGDSGRRRVSIKYYPRSYPGITMWAETLAELRRQQLKLRRGWRIGCSGNYETVYSVNRRLALAVVAGDKFTGVVGSRHPRLTRKRGRKTTERVDRNSVFGQLALELDLPELFDQLPPDEDCETRFLVVHPDAEEVRLELSLPFQVAYDGFVGDWLERILVPAIPISGAVAPIEPDEDDDDDGDIMVSKQA